MARFICREFQQIGILGLAQVGLFTVENIDSGFFKSETFRNRRIQVLIRQETDGHGRREADPRRAASSRRNNRDPSPAAKAGTQQTVCARQDRRRLLPGSPDNTQWLHKPETVSPSGNYGRSVLETRLAGNRSLPSPARREFPECIARLHV